MAVYEPLGVPGREGADADGAGQRQHRARAALRMAVGSAAAIALLVACAYTTMRGQAHPGSGARERLAGDVELAHALARDGLAPVEEAGGMSLVAATRNQPPGRMHATQTLPLGMNHKKGKRHKRKPHDAAEEPPPPPPGPCSGPFAAEDCADGPLSIDHIEPSHCEADGGCIITFTGRNIVAGADLIGHQADQEMAVSLRVPTGGGDDDGVVASTCTLINWMSKSKFECTLNAGAGAGLVWNVSIPNHDHKDDNEGTGWTWAGLTFSYDAPSINNIIPAVMDTNEQDILVVQGTNFGNSADNITMTVGGKPCVQIELVNDKMLRCLIPPLTEPGLAVAQITVGGQTVTTNIPVKDIPESESFPFTTANTFATEQWNITLAALMVRTGLTEDWFNDHQAIILVHEPEETVDNIMVRMHLERWEAVAVKLFRDYLKQHFAADAGHSVADEDGVYISNLGNRLNGDEQHDKQVLTKQLQVLEAATEMPRHELAQIIGNEVTAEPPCAGYPNCQPADAVGHRGWTWHWAYDEKRSSWVWKYGEISNGKQLPLSCGYCDPVKVHAEHDEAYAKQRETTCIYCVVDHFKNMDSCKCQDFKLMCLQADESLMHEAVAVKSAFRGTQELLDISPFALLHTIQELNKRHPHHHDAQEPAVSQPAATDAMAAEPVAASSPMVNPPWGETQCPVSNAAKKCGEMGGIPSGDGLACCPASCGTCGGPNCGGLPGGESSCCQGAITKSGQFCGSPPCLMDLSEAEDEAQQDARQKICASFGGFWANTSLQCCAASCGMCGGEGCESAPGGATKCCLDQEEGAQICSDSHSAPCMMAAGGGPGTPPSAHISDGSGGGVLSVSDQCRQLGGIPDPFGQVCCPVSCGACGGMECERRHGGGDACCVDDIVDVNVQCGSPPCAIAPVDDEIKKENSESCRASGGVPDASGFRCCPASW
eukprot:Tamp_01184.p1 GENE.Tamp_01184~~Tamp_01184.p1  ORF type:complete len:942 (-),score=141.12 Tamp_01184:2821-5646(-)